MSDKQTAESADLRARVEALAERREQQYVEFTRAAERAGQAGDDAAANWASNIAAIYRADANDLFDALRLPPGDPR